MLAPVLALGIGMATPWFGFALEAPSPSLHLRSAETATVDMAGLVLASKKAEMRAFANQMKKRKSLAKIHKPLGIATWAAMGITVALGTIQYYNLYGFFSPLEDTPCVKGNAIFGQGQCSGTPLLHLSTAVATGALYTGTLALSLLMPDPADASTGKGDYAKKLRMHKLLKWIHLGGMIAQFALGVVIANSATFGLDRANNYGTLQALSTVHMGIGFATFGAMTWAGLLML